MIYIVKTVNVPYEIGDDCYYFFYYTYVTIKNKRVLNMSLHATKCLHFISTTI